VRREAVKEEAQPSPRRGNRRLIAFAIAGAIALGAGGVWWIVSPGGPRDTRPGPETSNTTQGPRFSAARTLTRLDLEALRWDEVDQLLESVGTDDAEIGRLAELTGDVDQPAATYLHGLLLMLQREPERALKAFGTLEPQAIPPTFLYAPHRLLRALHPASPDPYLDLLRTAVVEGKVPALIRARVKAGDGELGAALASYLRTDPASWTNYDLESLRKIASHQGFAGDLRKLIAGAMNSGRVQPALTAGLKQLATAEPAPADIEEFKRQLKREIKANTPAGQVAVESAKMLIKDRNLFVGRKYAELIESHRDTEPIKLPTETALLLFLSAVELKEQIEMDRWGQELKRRHGDVEVRDWVNEMTGSAR
jgi:hypothetical protein